MQIVTISGRTIRAEAQGSPQRAEVAIMRIEALLAKLPAAALQTAKDMRGMRGQPLQGVPGQRQDATKCVGRELW